MNTFGADTDDDITDHGQESVEQARNYDPKCEELAQHFAQDEALTEAQVADLAESIQAAVEAWFLLAPPKDA